MQCTSLSERVRSHITGAGGPGLTGLATWLASNEDILQSRQKSSLISWICQPGVFVCNRGELRKYSEGSEGGEKKSGIWCRPIPVSPKKGGIIEAGRREGTIINPHPFPPITLASPAAPPTTTTLPTPPVTVRPNTWWIALSTEFIQGPINSAEMN